jgi:hypothetical protein
MARLMRFGLALNETFWLDPWQALLVWPLLTPPKRKPSASQSAERPDPIRIDARGANGIDAGHGTN